MAAATIYRFKATQHLKDKLAAIPTLKWNPDDIYRVVALSEEHAREMLSKRAVGWTLETADLELVQ